jgi:hypothetical protein
MVYAGMGPDYRVLVDKARKVSHTGYKRIYNEYPPTRILVQDVARVVQEATQSGGVRPYGVSLLVAGWDEGIEPEAADIKNDSDSPAKPAGKTGGILKGGPSLYQVDPSGSYYPWKATAIGKHATSAKTFLEKRYTEGLELEDAIHIALLTLKETIEGEMNGDTIEIGEWAFAFFWSRYAMIRVTNRLVVVDRYCGPPCGSPAGLRGRGGCSRPTVQEVDQGADRGLPDQPMRAMREERKCLIYPEYELDSNDHPYYSVLVVIVLYLPL